MHVTNNYSMTEEQLDLPEGFRPLVCQVAGHTFTDQTLAIGMLVQENGNCVLKPLGKPECGKRELSFYETLKNSKEPMLLKLKDFVPKFYCKISLMVNQREHVFIKLEDLTHGMSKPCVMDIKIGRRTWDPLATVEKRNVEEQKYIKCKQSIGLCLPGFQMYKICEDGDFKLIRCGKDYGKQLDATGFRETMARFLNIHHGLGQILINQVLQQLYAICSWFKSQRIYHFYASSILITYDAQYFSSIKDNNCTNLFMNGHSSTENRTTAPTTSSSQSCDDALDLRMSNTVKVRMIDFAHVFTSESSTLDTNYQFGLHNLIRILQNLKR